MFPPLALTDKYSPKEGYCPVA